MIKKLRLLFNIEIDTQHITEADLVRRFTRVLDEANGIVSWSREGGSG